MKVLSLCDGMSCGQIALNKLGVSVDVYFAAEIKSVAIKVTQKNYPNTIQLGDLNKVSYSNGVLHSETGDFITDIDLVIFGSPCQSFSQAMRSDMRVGLDDPNRSGLFFQCYRILKEVNPKYFLMENVASMRKCDINFVTKLMGVLPIYLDGQDVSAAVRPRLYWTNIPNASNPIIGKSVSLQSILTDGYTDKPKARCLLVSDSRPLTTPYKMFHRYWSTGFTTLIFKSKEHYEQCCKQYRIPTEIPYPYPQCYDGVRYLSQVELERCHCIPEGYTSCLSRNDAANVIGDGWNVDIIVHLFKGLIS